jgi:hypothetical protein
MLHYNDGPHGARRPPARALARQRDPVRRAVVTGDREQSAIVVSASTSAIASRRFNRQSAIQSPIANRHVSQFNRQSAIGNV